jgi:hypothetical protein
MKQVVSISFIALLVFSCNTERYIPKTDLEASNLKGRVQKIEKTIHKVNDKSKCPCNGLDENKQTFYDYDDKGNLIATTKLDEDGNIVLVSKYVYNRNGICTETDKYLPGDKPAGKEINTLRGKKVTEVKVLDEDENVENIYRYGYSGSELTEGKTLNKTGDLLVSFRNIYRNGLLESRDEKNILQNLTTLTKYNYNSANDISEYTITRSNENTEYKFTLEYEYDNQGNWVKQTQYYDGEIAGIVLRNIMYYN